MLSGIDIPDAKSDWWHATTRAVTAIAFVLLGGFAFAAIAGEAPRAMSSPLVAAEMLVNFCGFVLFTLEAIFVTLRQRPIAQAAGLAPRALALLGTWLMALLVLLPARESVPPAISLMSVVFGLVGDGLAIAAVANLGRSFSIMPEARRLVVSGPYQLMRHPLYVAEEITICGLVAVHFSALAVLLFAIQAACQWCRARNEEQILASAFSEFDAYHKRTPMLLPHLDQTAMWIGVASFAIVFPLGSYLLADPDTFLHVAAGQWMWAHGLVPSVDPFSATMRGAPWTAHEWLAELMFAGAFGVLGWAGVTALTALATACAFAMLGSALCRTLPLRGVVVTLALSFLLIAPHLVARPHVLAMPAMVGWMAGLVKARADDRAPSLALLPLLVLWANLHGSFPLAFLLAGFFAIEAVLAAPDRVARRKSFGGWAIFLTAAAAASFLTPLGWSGWRFPFELSGMTFSLGLVQEWQAANFARFQPLEILLLGLPALALCGSMRLSWLRLALLLLLIHLALVHTRFVDTVALLGPLLLAPSLRGLFGGLPAFRATWRPVESSILAVAVIVTITGLGAWRGVMNDDPRIAPRAALAAAGSGMVLNDYDFGDYLIFSHISPFVDGRIDLYGDRFMLDYMSALNAQGNALPELLARYHVGWTILKPNRPAVALLDRLPGWHRAYADANAVVHVKDDDR
jgi:protein-S-isoprenylcysteine O-methyltransferase Ste14